MQILGKNLGHKPAEVFNGEEALKLLAQVQDKKSTLFHFIFMDSDLGAGNIRGETVIQQIRAMGESIFQPIIIAYSSDSDSNITMMEKGATDFLLKPALPCVIQAKLHQYQDQVRLQLTE